MAALEFTMNPRFKLRPLRNAMHRAYQLPFHDGMRDSFPAGLSNQASYPHFPG